MKVRQLIYPKKTQCGYLAESIPSMKFIEISPRFDMCITLFTFPLFSLSTTVVFKQFPEEIASQNKMIKQRDRLSEVFLASPQVFNTDIQTNIIIKTSYLTTSRHDVQIREKNCLQVLLLSYRVLKRKIINMKDCTYQYVYFQPFIRTMNNKKVGSMKNITLQTCQNSKSIILFVKVQLKTSRILFSLCPDHQNITVKTHSFKLPHFLSSNDQKTSKLHVECTTLPKVTGASLIYTQQKKKPKVSTVIKM